ncbi:hypothetical protein B0H19DRAFT_1080356 [Mycena capillaripes]|nr:hypothetical protein B0H19DRAFT_1080356 [Mycena capillaripes]
MNSIVHDVVNVAEEVASGAGEIVTQGVEVVKEVANDAGDIAAEGIEVVKDVANDAGMIVTQSYRSTAREGHDFVNDPDPLRIVTAPMNIVGDVAERLPGPVGGLVHDLKNPTPRDRSNWMRENKAHLANKRLHEISIRWLTAVCSSPELMTQAKAQELDFLMDLAGQLNAGVRYFDWRIGVSKHDESLRIVHSL